MSKTEVIDLISVACVGGAIVIALLAARLPAPDPSAIAKKVRAALLGCSVLLVLAGMAVALTAESVSTLAAQVSMLDGERNAQSRDREASAARLDDALRALPKITAAVDNVGSRAIETSEQLRLERLRLHELALQVARIQQVVAERAGFDRLESVVLGQYVVGFETHVLIPAAARESDQESWWVDFSEFARGTEKLKFRGKETLFVCVKGVRSVRGRYGHLGGSQYLFLVSEVLAVGARAQLKCAQRTASPLGG